jgi:hypothetical protein
MKIKTRLPFVVYFFGILPLGYLQDDVRAVLGDWMSFVAILGYLFILRLIGWGLVRFVESRHLESITQHNRLVEDSKMKKVQRKT